MLAALPGRRARPRGVRMQVGTEIGGAGGSGVPGAVRLTVIAPAHNEAENLALLIEQVGRACRDAGVTHEFLIVDDASTDQTVEIVTSLIEQDGQHGWLRLVSLPRPPQGRGNGQSAAFKAGFAHARGERIALLDADLQNDPADLVRMLAIMDETGADFVQGDRSAARREGDPWIRQAGSWVGRTFRKMILGDSIRDTGCSLRVMRREIALALPLEFKGMHRFIPVTARHLGYTVVEMPVTHRPRHAGEPKYGMGIASRAIPGLIDCFAVRWMANRRRLPGAAVEHRGGAGST